MRRVLFAGVLAAALVAFVSAPVLQAADQRVVGTVVDLKCKTAKATDPCHLTGAKAGDVMTLKGKDGKAYTIVGPYAASLNAKLLPFVGKSVTATGTVKVAGTKRTIDIKTIK